MYLWTKRRFERLKVGLKVGIEADAPLKSKRRILTTYDISPASAFVVTDEPLNLGTKVFLKIILPSGERSVVHGMVWRSVANGMVICFEHLCQKIIREFGDSYETSNKVNLLFPSNLSA